MANLEQVQCQYEQKNGQCKSHDAGYRIRSFTGTSDAYFRVCTRHANALIASKSVDDTITVRDAIVQGKAFGGRLPSKDY